MPLEKGSVRSRALSVTPLAMLTSGSIYAFGIYSDTLRKILDLTNTQINIVALGSNIGMWVCFHAGIWVDSFGPRSACVIGAGLCFVGYFLLYLRATDRIPGNTSAMALYAMCFGSGCSWIDVATMTVSMKNFPDEGHMVAGFTKLFLGLSASILSIFYSSFFYGDAVNFLLFMAIFSVIDMLPVMYFMRVDEDGKNGPELLNVASTISFLVLAVCGTTAILDATSVINPPPEHQSVWFGLLAVVWVLLLAMQSINYIGVPDLAMQKMSSFGPARAAMYLTPSEALRDYRFWTVFIITTCCSGAAIVMVNNIAEIYKSYNDGDDSGKSLLVSLFGIFNGLGRLMIGLVLSKFKIPTTKAYVFILLGVIASELAMVFIPKEALYVAMCALGFLYGAMWVILPSLCKDFFGTHYFGTIYGFSCLAAATGSLIFSTLIAGKLYDAVAVNNECRGTHCFQLTFTIILVVNIIAFFMCVLLYFQTLETYQNRGYFRVSTTDDSIQRHPTAGGLTSTFPPHTQNKKIEKAAVDTEKIEMTI